MHNSLKKIKSQLNPGKEFLISIAVRVKNEIKGLPEFIKSIKKQTYYENAELIFLDSGSTDGTLKYLVENINCNIYSIDSNDFSFGDSCNLMMDLTNCSYVFFFSGHIVLQDPTLLEEAFSEINGKNISGYFRQLPNYNFGCSIYDKAFLSHRFPGSKIRKPIIIKDKHSFSNAASVISRSNWQTHKFNNVIFGEDEIWVDALLASREIVYYFPYLSVLHSHNDSYEDVYVRVSKAARVKYPDGAGLLVLMFIFFKVFGAVFLSSGKILGAVKFAQAHTKAYVDAKRCEDN